MSILLKLSHWILSWHYHLSWIIVGIGFVVLLATKNVLIKNIYSYIAELFVLWTLIYVIILIKETDKEKFISQNLGEIATQYLILFFLFLSLRGNIESNISFQIYLVFSILSISFLIIYLYKCIKTIKGIKYILIGLAFFTYCIFIWNNSIYIELYGNEIIGSFFEKSEYRTQYYVNLHRNQYTNNPYRLVADIYVHTIETGWDYDFVNDDARTTYAKVIELEKIYFPNGGYLHFEETYIEIKKKNRVSDQNMQNWYVELTDNKP